MNFNEIAELDFNISSIERVFVKKGQKEFFALALNAANGKKRLEIMFPKKIGECKIKANSEDPRTALYNKVLRLISISPIQTRKGVGFTLMAHSDINDPERGSVYSYGVWFEPEAPGTYLKVEDLELSCVDPRKNNQDRNLHN